MPKPKAKLNTPAAPPALLTQLQTWFSEAILTENTHHADQYITLSKAQSSQERLNIYIHDYWPRCLESLAEDFPGLSQILGETAFDHWMKQYLTEYPSSSFTLFHLGQHLPHFMHMTYQGAHKAFVTALTRYEWAKAKAYFSAQHSCFNPASLTPTEQEKIAQIPVTLQPHISVLQLDYDCGQSVRKHFKKIPRPRETFCVIYRDLEYTIQEQLISRTFYHMLMHLHEAKSIEQLLDVLLETLSPEEHTYLEQHIQTWLGLCVQKGWLTHL